MNVLLEAYVIINRATGEPAHTRTYTNARDAKLALKCHFGGKRVTHYAIARIQAMPSALIVADEDGKWTEVTAE